MSEPITGAGDDEEVVVSVQEGVAGTYPRSVRTVMQRSVFDDLRWIAEHIRQLEQERDELVSEGRAAGLSWNSIGMATNYTGLGASMKWAASEGGE
jgi:hypothetical protein